jgi:uncharacterized protein
MTSNVHPPPPLRPAPRRRGALRRYLETRGMLGGHDRPHVTTRLVADDGTRLVGTYLPSRGGPEAVLVLHGFAANRRKPAYARLADGLAGRRPVLSLDLRGHGGSSGWSTLGDREASDVAAGVRWLQRVGHRRVVVVGSSMGATAAMHATARDVDIAALVVISATSRFRATPETEPMRRLATIWESPSKRQALRLLVGVQLAGPEAWGPPPHPVDLVARSTSPLLAVHGHDDAYFPVTDAVDLARAAGGPSALWLEPPGFGHAEDGLTPEFVARLSEAIDQVLTTGRFPAQWRCASELAAGGSTGFGDRGGTP